MQKQNKISQRQQFNLRTGRSKENRYCQQGAPVYLLFLGVDLQGVLFRQNPSLRISALLDTHLGFSWGCPVYSPFPPWKDYNQGQISPIPSTLI